MRKKTTIVLIFTAIIMTAACIPAPAQSGFEHAAKMADEIHKQVEKDVIYTDQEIKALYYQNVQIIALLEEIKELLRQNLTNNGQ